ncbi:DUF2334 domain-containing protein, partial [Bacillus nitratireducens]|uniref:DUF2334 domain-containing protein n=1 Tax=Bacillus nitratireducens TaxID=2026193 RepID=UPI00284E11E4
THRTTAYLRREDVDQDVDGNLLEEISEILKEKNLPYNISIIPVYKDPNTVKTIHLQDNFELLDVLRIMQDNGGS